MSLLMFLWRTSRSFWNECLIVFVCRMTLLPRLFCTSLWSLELRPRFHLVLLCITLYIYLFIYLFIYSPIYYILTAVHVAPLWVNAKVTKGEQKEQKLYLKKQPWKTSQTTRETWAWRNMGSKLVPNLFNSKKLSPTNILIKLSKIKPGSLESIKKKRGLSYTGNPISTLNVILL